LLVDEIGMIAIYPPSLLEVRLRVFDRADEITPKSASYAVRQDPEKPRDLGSLEILLPPTTTPTPSPSAHLPGLQPSEVDIGTGMDAAYQVSAVHLRAAIIHTLWR
jgi:hypothetical protein